MIADNPHIKIAIAAYNIYNPSFIKITIVEKT